MRRSSHSERGHAVKRLRKKSRPTVRNRTHPDRVGRGYKAASLDLAGTELYWRIALGLFAFLALMLAAEGALFLG